MSWEDSPDYGSKTNMGCGFWAGFVIFNAVLVILLSGGAILRIF